MWGKIKKVVSFIDDYIFGIYIVLVIVGIIMMLTAQAFVIFILGFVLVIGGHVLPFSNYKILKIASEKETQTKKATTSDYLFWKKVEAILDWFTNPIMLVLIIFLIATASAATASAATASASGVGSLLLFILAIVIPIGAVDLWKFVSRKVRKMENEQNHQSLFM